MQPSFFRRHPHPLALAVALSLGACASLAVSAAPPQNPPSPSAQAPNKALLSAMRRDLGLDERQAMRYLDAERSAILRAPLAKRQLGDRYAGSWLETDGRGGFRTVVAATDAASAAQARTLGVETRLVKRSLAQLDGAKSLLDRASRQRKRDAGIHAWYVDVRTNQIVIEGDFKAKRAAQELVLAAGMDAAAVRFQESADAPMPATIIGGEGYNSAAGNCSIGFSITRGADVGFATAGHCGPVGTATTNSSNVLQGVVAGSTYPVNDSGWVKITNIGQFIPINLVTNYAGGFVNVVGSAQAPVGAAVCRSGRVTGYRCGTISAHNVTVNYPEGRTFGLTRTSACVGFGDSGGAYITPAGQAQGVTSGGSIPTGASDNCASGSPISFHQPIVPLLNQYGLTLFTGGGSTGSLPTISRFICPDYNNSGGGTYICTIDYASGTPANVVWTGGNGSATQDPGSSTFYATCLRGQALQVTATVSNGAGSVSRTSARFTCPTGPIP